MAFRPGTKKYPCGMCGEGYPWFTMMESWRDEHVIPVCEAHAGKQRVTDHPQEDNTTDGAQ
eukprot:10312566-Prorocentrum_lima.AAC.1